MVRSMRVVACHPLRVIVCNAHCAIPSAMRAIETSAPSVRVDYYRIRLQRLREVTQVCFPKMTQAV
jgi:hypothetical protein